VNFSINPMLTYMAKLRVGDPLKHRLPLDHSKA
jgi:hypothetical protein